MSTQSVITDYIVAQAAGKYGKPIKLTPEDIAAGSQMSRVQVNKTLNNLSTRKRVKLLRGDNGRTIVGYELLEPPADKRRKDSPTFVPRETPSAPRPPIRVTGYRARQVYTPMLDAYAEAKSKFERMQSELGDHIEARFKEDIVAEEGLALRERLTLVEESLHEYRERAETAERDAAALRGRHRQQVAAAAVEAGALVQHSSD